MLWDSHFAGRHWERPDEEGLGSPVCIKQSGTWTPTTLGPSPHKPRLPGFGRAIGCEPGIQREEVMERSKPEGHLGFCQAARKHTFYRACLEGLWRHAPPLLAPQCWAVSTGSFVGHDGILRRSRTRGLEPTGQYSFGADLPELCLVPPAFLWGERLLPSFCRWGYWESEVVRQACIDGGWGPSQELAFLTSAANLLALNPRPLFFLDIWVFFVPGKSMQIICLFTERILQEAPELLPPPSKKLSRPLWAVVSGAWQGPCRLGFMWKAIFPARFVTSRTFCLSVNQE